MNEIAYFIVCLKTRKLIYRTKPRN